MDSELIDLHTGDRDVVLDLTAQCERFVSAHRGSGLLHVFVPHATAGVAVLETGAGSDDDLLALVDRADPQGLPALYVCCGEQDELIGDNRALVEACAGASVPVTASFGPGEHDWAYWDDTIQDVLAWLPLRTGG